MSAMSGGKVGSDTGVSNSVGEVRDLVENDGDVGDE